MNIFKYAIILNEKEIIIMKINIFNQSCQLKIIIPNALKILSFYVFHLIKNFQM